LAYNTFEPVGGADPNLSPIIFLHGVTAFKENWEDIPQVVANATKRLSYSVDGRNHGDSEWSEQFSFDLNVDDLVHFMDSRGIQKAVIVGHSMGGITAIKTALRKPERIESIVVEDMFVRKIPQPVMDTVIPYVMFMQKALEEAPPQLDELEIKKFVLKYILEQMPQEMRKLASSGRSGDLDSNARFLSFRRSADGRFTSKSNLAVIERALRNMDTISSDPEGQFRGPACFIYGKMSPFLVGADEHHIKQFFPEAILVGIDDVGHDVHNSKPLEFTDVLLKFLS